MTSLFGKYDNDNYSILVDLFKRFLISLELKYHSTCNFSCVDIVNKTANESNDITTLYYHVVFVH